MTTLSYIKQNSNEAKKMEVKSNQSANLNQIEEEKVKNKSLQLTKNKGEVNNDMSKKDEYKNQYMNLRNLLNQIIDLKNEELNPVNNQKTKRIK